MATTLAACAVGPTYHRPAAPLTSGYALKGSPSPTAPAPASGGEAQRFFEGRDIPGAWWSLFKSPQLNELIERGLRHNPSLEAAQAALRQANEALKAQRGALYPSVSAEYQALRARESGAEVGEPQIPSFLYTLNSASVNVSYTLDVFGGIRRQVEALQAQSDYQRHLLEASYLSLTANIVTAAVAEASLRAQIDATEHIVRLQQSELDITRRRLSAGAASRADVLQQQAALDATLAALPALRSQLAQERTLLAAYVGDFPADYAGAEFTLDSLALPLDLPLSVPSKLVEQRPDVQEYAALLHQATAQVGVATANLLPQITLTGSYGGVATQYSQVFSPSSAIWNLVGGITQPLFNGGGLTHQRRAALAAAQEAAANYKNTVITAFQNVSSTLYALQSDAETFAAQSEALGAADAALKLTEAQYRSGGASHLQVLIAEQTYQSAVVALVKARAQRLADTAALFQALGGGWWNRPGLVDAADCCKESL